MNNRPGTVNFLPPRRAPQMEYIASMGTSVAPICCVIAPASRAATVEPLI
jgi:hypothetical protein